MLIAQDLHCYDRDCVENEGGLTATWRGRAYSSEKELRLHVYEDVQHGSGRAAVRGTSPFAVGWGRGRFSTVLGTTIDKDVHVRGVFKHGANQWLEIAILPADNHVGGHGFRPFSGARFGALHVRHCGTARRMHLRVVPDVQGRVEFAYLFQKGLNQNVHRSRARFEFDDWGVGKSRTRRYRKVLRTVAPRAVMEASCVPQRRGLPHAKAPAGRVNRDEFPLCHAFDPRRRKPGSFSPADSPGCGTTYCRGAPAGSAENPLEFRGLF